VVAHGLVGIDEIAAGRSLRVGPRLNRVLRQEDAKIRGSASYERKPRAPAHFKVGDKVRTRNMHPRTHTRLPRYARDKLGIVEAIRGCHVYPDTAAIAAGDNPQWLYTIVFSARELWGEADSDVTVSIEAFEPYLLPA
jgi:nitrile hydratase subunit beta